MIKFFQKLKAKKGFTLVELIVVIAIIGVLAAILIPTMLGYVTSSRVTSANSTAASIKNNIDAFLTKCDTAGYGMLRGSNNKANFLITVQNGTWKVQFAPTATIATNNSTATSGAQSFKSKANIGDWTAAPSGVTKDTQLTTVAGKALDMLAVELCGLFPDMKSASAEVYCVGGKALYCWYTADADGSTNNTVTAAPSVSAFQNTVYEWDNKTAGVTSQGYIMGTAPACSLGSVAASNP